MSDGLQKYQLQKLNEQLDCIVAERDTLRAALSAATARAEAAEAMSFDIAAESAAQAQNQREELTAMRQRAEAAEAKLERVEEYAEYCIAAGGASEYFASFEDWLAHQSEVQP